MMTRSTCYPENSSVCGVELQDGEGLPRLPGRQPGPVKLCRAELHQKVSIFPDMSVFRACSILFASLTISPPSQSLQYY